MKTLKKWVVLLLSALACLLASLFVDALFGALLAFTAAVLSLAALLLAIRSESNFDATADESKEAGK